MRPASSSMESVKDGLRKLQAEIREAKKIVIIGGGPVGVEVSGVSSPIPPLQRESSC